MAEGRFEMKLTGLFIPCGAISDCGTLLMYGGHMLVLVNLRDGQCTDLVPRLEGRPDSRVQCCVFSSSLERKSPTLAAATLDSQLLIFELIACATLATFEAPSPLLACAIAPRAQFGGAEVRAAAVDVGGSVLVWRLELQQSNRPASLCKPADAPLLVIAPPVPRAPAPSSGGITAAASSSDAGDADADAEPSPTALADHFARLDSSDAAAAPPNASGWRCLHFASATLLATGGGAKGGRFGIWDVSDARSGLAARPDEACAGHVVTHVLSDLGASPRLLVVTDAARAEVWDAKGATVLCTLRDGGSASADGNGDGGGGGGGGGGEGVSPMTHCGIQETRNIREACWSRSGRLVCTLCGRDTLRLYDSYTGELVHRVHHKGHQFHISIGLSPDDEEGTADDGSELWILGLGAVRSKPECFAQKLPAIDWRRGQVLNSNI